jgi:hypothetical protein
LGPPDPAGLIGKPNAWNRSGPPIRSAAPRWIHSRETGWRASRGVINHLWDGRSSANRGRYSPGDEQDPYDDEPAVTSSDYHRDHASDGHDETERDPEHGVCLDHVDHSNRQLGEHPIIVQTVRRGWDWDDVGAAGTAPTFAITFPGRVGAPGSSFD